MSHQSFWSKLGRVVDTTAATCATGCKNRWKFSTKRRMRARSSPLASLSLELVHRLVLRSTSNTNTCSAPVSVLRLTHGCSTQYLNFVMLDCCESRPHIHSRSYLLIIIFSAENAPPQKNKYFVSIYRYSDSID